MSTPVSIVRSVPLSCDAFVPLVRVQLQALEEASEHGTVVLGAAIPGDGRVTVPVRVRVGYPPPKTPRYRLTIAARSAPALYPRFRGQLELVEAGAAATKLMLSGAYDVPLAIVGRAFDASAVRGIAPRGLEDLVDRLVADVVAAVAHASDAAYRASRCGE
jgi:hypothetical protein